VKSAACPGTTETLADVRNGWPCTLKERKGPAAEDPHPAIVTEQVKSRIAAAEVNAAGNRIPGCPWGGRYQVLLLMIGTSGI
jgi:hypothetical protein